MQKVIMSACLITLLFSCQHYVKWNVAYKNDREGNSLFGSKERLINAIRQGASIRIGWGWKGEQHSIEHLSEPIWLAVLDEKEVMAHLDPQVLSSVDWEELKGTYADSTLLNQEWRVVINTNGQFDAVWYDRADHSIKRRMPQNHTMTWFVKDVRQNGFAPLYAE